MFTQKKSTAPRAPRRLYSIHGLLQGREIAGTMAAGKTEYRFTYAPTAAALANDKLELTGSFTVTTPRGVKRSINGVRARLAATQGSTLNAPPRPERIPVPTSGQISTSDQKQEEAATISKLPITDATDTRGHVGVMYLHLSPLDAKALGVPFDLSQVQLNARLAPVDELAQELHFLYSAIVATAYGATPNQPAAAFYLGELNRRLKS